MVEDLQWWFEAVQIAQTMAAMDTRMLSQPHPPPGSDVLAPDGAGADVLAQFTSNVSSVTQIPDMDLLRHS